MMGSWSFVIDVDVVPIVHDCTCVVGRTIDLFGFVRDLFCIVEW